ncbi:QsdR family transcriptional regulator [Nocardia sp. NPDC050435]|uniref:QsdR family transcriptional regulator n=1 Tax=Nocardia sp. NPDC050435 TaxID=3155040 RepID=UPI0033C53590
MYATPEEIVRYAADLIRSGTRLDTQAIAAQFGMSRTTLFRKVGNREQLLGEALWWLAEAALSRANDRWQREYGTALRDDRGRLRSLRILEYYGATVVGDPGFAWLLENDPTALRVLTNPQGEVQPRLIAAHATLFDRDILEGGLAPVVDVQTLSFAVVRLEDAILYSDVLAGHAANFPAAVTLVQHLVESVLQASAPA